MKKICPSSGFTLIEILIVMLIFSVLTSSGYLAYTNLITRKTLDKAYREIRSGLLEAKKMAEYGKKDKCIAEQQLYGYEFSWDENNNVYSFTLSALCDEDSIFVKSVQLDKGIVLSGGEDNEIIFKVLDGKPVKQYDLKVSLDEQEKEITIGSLGELR
ncbi:prepilin-type N-terminal cleavage/methylation domain-containing protein [Candidatus Beckwithbacteria bacterium]|nr:prepilin-type N-terminal cleavage/methylation domain-containing protein [Candidatus Beckwithbacteria bacterium]